MAAPDESPVPPGTPRVPLGPRTATFVVDGLVTPATIPDLCERLRGLLEGDGLEVVVCDLGALEHADVATLDALARLQLTARRAGCDLQFRRVSKALHGLLALTGFAEVLRIGEGPAVEGRAPGAPGGAGPPSDREG